MSEINLSFCLQAQMEYVRSPFSPRADTTVSPIFLPIVPEMNSRIECGCQPVAVISSLAVTPPLRFRSSITRLVLLPWCGALALAAAVGNISAPGIPALPLMVCVYGRLTMRISVQGLGQGPR